MSKNTIRKTFLHSARRTNSFTRKGSKPNTNWLLFSVLLCVISVGTYFAYTKLHAIWIEQCKITDLSRQVSITTGEYVKAGAILEFFKIRNGTNLAKINFAERHREAIKQMPNIKSLTIVRHLPSSVEFHIEERDPIARINIKGKVKTSSARVIDSDGVVFNRQRGTSLLPTIYDAKNSIYLTKDGLGKTLDGRAKAALQLIAMCQRDFQSLGILSVDTTHPDYLIATLGNYSQAKISWENMDTPTIESEEALSTQLDHLQSAIKASGSSVKVWNVTSPNYAIGDTKEPIL